MENTHLRTAQLYVIVASQHSVLNAIRVKETEIENQIYLESL